MKKFLYGVMPLVSVFVISLAWAEDVTYEYDAARVAAIPAHGARRSRPTPPPAPPVHDEDYDDENYEYEYDDEDWDDVELSRAAIRGIPARARPRANPAVAPDAVAPEPAASRFAMVPVSGGVASAAAVSRMASTPAPAPEPAPVQNADTCREAYRECMDQFCMDDPLNGERCMCSNSILEARTLQREVEGMNDEAARIRTEEVERVQLGTRADAVFSATASAGGNAARQQRQAALMAMFNNSTVSNQQEELIGDALFQSARSSCAARLAACGTDAQMVETVYLRDVQTDCRRFMTYLNDLRREAQGNRRIAESEVRVARTAMLDVTDRFNRGECLLAFRACVAEKGGCGDGFENCVDRRLITRRAHACENILDECNAVRREVMRDWDEEVKHLLAQAEINNEANMRRTCRARTWDCLEESCSYATNAQCLNSIGVAAGMCPVINECNALIPGFRQGIADSLGELRTRFCQNDATRCLQETCGANFTNPECVGKRIADIQALCRQDRFLSCREVAPNEFISIITAVLWQIDHSLMEGCVNHFAEQVGRICGNDMACLPPNPDITLARDVASLEALFRPDSRTGRTPLQEWSAQQVDTFMRQLQQDRTVRQCSGSIGNNVFNATRMMAAANAEDRVIRQYFSRMTELARTADQETRRKMCEETMLTRLSANNSAHNPSENRAGNWIVEAIYEPELRNCRVLRRQKVCATSGQTRGSNMVQGMTSGFTAGAAVGTTANVGIGTAIGGLVGGIGGALAGRSLGGQQTECNSIDVWDNINM